MNIAALKTNWATPLLVGFAIIGAMLAGVSTSLHGLDTLIWLALGVAFIVVFVHPRVGLYTMLFLVPLQSLMILESGMTLVRVVGLVTGVAWGVSKLSKKEPIRPLVMGPLAIPMFSFLFVCAISALWSDFTAWHRDMSTYIQLVAWVFMMFDLIDSPERLKRALFFFSLGAMISAGILNYGFISRSTPLSLYYRPEGGHGDANYTASTLLVVLPILLSYMRHQGGWQWFGGLISAAFLLLAVGITASRTALLITLILLISQFITLPNRSRRVKFLFIVLLVFLAVLPLWPWRQITYRFSAPDLYGRYWRARYGLQVFIENPVVGRGLGRMDVQYDIVHNLFLEMLAQLGLPGLLSIVWIWVVAWRSLSEAQKRASTIQNQEMSLLISAIRLSMFVYLLFSLALSTHRTRTLWLIFALAGICYRILEGMHAARERESLPSRPKKIVRAFR